jgi:hypothetical protein
MYDVAPHRSARGESEDCTSCSTAAATARRGWGLPHWRLGTPLTRCVVYSLIAHI